MKNIFSTKFMLTAFTAFAFTGLAAQDGGEPCFGSEVLSFEQGLQTNGNPVAADRSNPEVALGAPAGDNSAGSFFSLGVGGFIEIGFDGIVLDGPGNDLRVVETSFSGNDCGLNDDEFAEVELSNDGINYVSYGTICRNEEIDIAQTGLEFITAIRITNAEGTTTPDGYDLDGVVAINGCEDFPVEQPGCFGFEVLSFEQGLQTNGNPVAADRSNPEVALGAPAGDNSAGSFFSLGVGGFIEIGFDGIVLDGPGNDLLVVETSFSGNDCGFSDDEFADIELSNDGINYVSYGTICRNEEIDIASTGLDFITSIRISNAEMTSSLDGYDLDGVIAINGCEDFPVEQPGCFGFNALVYEPGTGNIPADRANPENALGAPEGDDSINFVALGFGGTLVIGFEEAAIALEGQDDLEVVETTFGNQSCSSYEERANIYVSQQVVADASEIDHDLFELVGESCTNGVFLDVYGATGFEYFTLVKIVDTTPEAAQLSNRDGYDVDGIVALHGCQEVPELIEIGCEGPWRTQSQGGWGSPGNGNNPGVYRDANFADAFPNGLVLGCADGNTLTLTSASAVQSFLPSGGQPSPLSSSLTNPTGNQGSFAGQLTALALSLGFDANDADFSESETPLADLVVQSGSFEGYTVGELFDIANDVFGGCSEAFTAQQLNGILDDINNAYTDGNDQGSSIIACPGPEVDDTPDPFCTNETVIQPHTVTDGNVRLTAMGFYQECSGEFGYRWRIRNESGEPRVVTYSFAGGSGTEGTFELEGDEAVFFTTGFGQQTSGGGTMIIFVNGEQVDVKAHGGSTKDLAECGDGCPDVLPQMPPQSQLDNLVLETYPNPSQGLVNVEFTTTKDQRVTIEIMDMSGRVVSTVFNADANNNQTYRIDFNGQALPNGIYITKMTTENETVIRKVMIAR